MGATLGLTSCNDFLDMTPTDKISDKGVWTNVSTAEYSVNYLYSYIYDVVASQCVAGETEALTDQLKYGSYNYNSLCFIPSEIAYGGSNLTATYVDAYLGYWGSWYSAVRRTNQEISSLKKYGTLAESDAVRLEAEMRFVRAYLYFDLMKRYKEVIIYDEDLTAITENKALNTEKRAGTSSSRIWNTRQPTCPRLRMPRAVPTRDRHGLSCRVPCFMPSVGKPPRKQPKRWKSWTTLWKRTMRTAI